MHSMAFVSVALFQKRKIVQERILAVFLIVKKTCVRTFKDKAGLLFGQVLSPSVCLVTNFKTKS